MQVQRLSIAVDGQLINAMVAVVTRTIAVLDTVGMPSVRPTLLDNETADRLVPVSPWYFERLVVHPTTLRVTLSFEGVLPDALAFLAAIQHAQLMLGDVNMSDVLIPLEQLCLMVCARAHWLWELFSVLLKGWLSLYSQILKQYKGDVLRQWFAVLTSNQTFRTLLAALSVLVGARREFAVEAQRHIDEVC